jgi:hypothetical protein
MQHPSLRAVFLSLCIGSFFCFGLSGPSVAGQMHRYPHGQVHITGHGKFAGARPPVVISRAQAPDAPRAVATPINAAANAVVIPLPRQLQARQLFAHQLLGIDGDTIPPQHPTRSVHGQSLPLEMLSGHPVGANTIISRLPSGSIVMQSPAQFYGYYNHTGHHRGAAIQGPYAPPTFQIIGKPSGRNMGKPVRLTYGIPAQKRLNPSPQVIWIKAERSGKNIEIIR